MFLKTHTEKGFTLIEVIASLVLAGILAAVAGMGIVQATRAFLFTKQTTEISQKNSLPMIRLRRSVMNLTDVSAITARSLTLNRLNNGTEISETYNWGGNAGDPLTVSINNGTAQTLADNTQNFSLTFTNSQNTAWTITDPLTDLAQVTIGLTLRGGSGTNVVFSEKVLPRNTYLPNASSGGVASGTTSGQQTPLCFIQNNAFSSDANPGIRVIREFKNKIIANLPLGKEIIGLYYRFSRAADMLLGSGGPDTGAWLRIMLLPFTGLFFLILYYPLGILWFFLIALVLVRLLLKLDVFKLPGRFKLNNARGSILITIIATMVIMGFLSIAMVSMFSSSVIGTIPPQMSQRAYYVAESGKRYAVKAFLANRDNDQNFINALHINQAFPLGSDSFTLGLEGYWYNKSTSTSNFTSVTVAPYGDFPSELKAQSRAGYLQLPGITNLVEYTSTTYDSGANTVRFAVPRVSGTSGAGPVFLAARANSQTLTATELGEDPNLAHVLVPQSSGQTAAFPEVNGLITLTDSSAHDWVLIYRKKLAGGNLAGLQYIPGQSYTTGIVLANDTGFVLGRHAIFTSTGRSGTGTNQSVQAIKVHQPLDSIELYKKIQGGVDFNTASDINKVNSKLGTHAIDGGALKVTSTSTTYSYTSFNGSPVYQQESLSTVNWANTGFPSNFLRDIWNRSSQKLTYDLQAKIKFTETEDDVDNAPVNHPGSYMPGLSFRVLAPNSGSFGQATYYGLSVMRGIAGIEQHSQSSGGCGGTTYYYTENDDITDNLFYREGDHGSNSSAASVNTCSGTSFVPSSWNDDAPLDGIPYLVLWQKDVSTDASGNAVSTGCFGGSDYSPWEWLSYMSLVEVQPVTVYEYNRKNTSNYYYYEGQPGSLPEAFNKYNTQSFSAWKLKDRFGVLQTSTITVSGVTTTILGSPGPSGIFVRNPATASGSSYGTPMASFNGAAATVGYILNPTATYSTDVKKAENNYKIYLKPWSTLMVRVYEMQGNLDCNTSTGNAAGEERVNAISAYIAGPEATAGTLGLPKDGTRLAHPRNTVKWAEDGDYFTTAIWKGLNTNGVMQNETGYTSKLVPNPQSNGCGGTGANIKLVEKGKDNVGDNLITYTASYTTENYGTYFNNPSATYNVAEFGLHSLGINSVTTNAASDRETVYFDDFYWSLWEGGAAGIFPGIQEQ